MSKLKVGLLGGSGAVGQTYQKLLRDHPYFDLVYMPTREVLGCIEQAKGCELFFFCPPKSDCLSL